MDIYQIMARLDAISSKKTLTESQTMAEPVAEGQMKRDLENRAEKMSKADFVANAGEYGMSAEEAADFWAAVNGEEEIDEAYDKLPVDQLGLDKFSQAALSGGQRKRDALANPNHTRMLAKKSAQQQPVKEVIATTVKKGDRVSVEGKPAVVVGQMKTPAGAAKYFAVRFDGRQYPSNTYDQVHANRLFAAEVDEGNEFSGELAQAKAAGAKEFKVDGKTYPVKEAKKAKPDFLDMDKDGDKKEPMKKAVKDKNDAKGSFQKQMGGSAKELTKGLSIGAKKVSEQLDEVFPGTPEYELRFGKDDASSAFDKKKISTGTVYSRRYQDEPEADDDAPRAAGRPKGSKRRLGAKGPSVDSKLLKGKGGLKEQDIDIRDRGEYDREGDMALNQVHQIADAARELHAILAADENLPEWVQSKITKALDYIDTSRDYLKAKGEQYTDRGQEPMAEYSFNKTDKKDRKEPTLNLPKNTSRPMMRSKNADDDQSISSQASISRKRNYMEEPVAEKAVSKAQQKFMGMVHAAKKGAKPASAAVAKVAQGMSGKDAEDFAATKHKGLPAKKSGRVEEESTDTRDQRAEKAGKRVARDLEYDMKHQGKDDDKAERAGKKVTKDIEYDDKKDKKKEVDETTVAGSVATSAAPATSKGGMQFGKGVYEGALAESFEKKMKQLNESYSVNVSVDDGGRKNITVTASDEQADQLGQMLKMAGLFSSEGYSRVCDQCHGIHEAGACGAEQVDEELANAPDEQYSDTDTMVNTLSGGLNGPKLQSNPNNMGDNPLAMSRLGHTSSPSLNLGDIAEGVEKESTTRLWDLYRDYKSK